MTTPTVYVAGVPVEALADIGDLVISHEWPTAGIGGPVSAQFSLALSPQDRPGWLAKGSLADVRYGGMPILAGYVADIDWSDGGVGTVTIDGAAREGATTACLTAGGLTSSTPDTFIDAAISRGALTWSRPASISTTALTDGSETHDVNSVSDGLALYADTSGSRLYVDPARRLMKGADPTSRVFSILPGAGELSWTTEQQATRVIGGWHNSAGTPQITSVGSGAIEKMVNLDVLGPLDSTRATNVLNSILAKSSAGGWVNGLTLSAEHFVGPPSLCDIASQVGSGLMVRLLGQRDPRPGGIPVGYVDFIVARSEWRVADGTITLSPRGMVADTWAAILAEVGVQEAA